MRKIGRRMAEIAHALAKRGFPVTPNDRRLAALEGRFEGGRAVIIGNGPSLRVEDLDRLAGWVTFACNKIYLAFESTTWRPDFYSICDVKLAEHANEFDFGSHFANTTIINAFRVRDALHHQAAVHHYRYREENCISHWQLGSSPPTPPRSFATGIYPGGNSVTIDQLQMAYLMGFREVAIIGADLSYFGGTKTGETSRSGELIRYDGNEAEKNYFHKDYYQPGAVTTVPNIEKMKHAWDFCRVLFESSGRTLVNASRESALEHVTRVEFDALFPRVGTRA